MGGKRFLLLLGTCILGAGCGHRVSFVRNLAYESARVTDETALRARNWWYARTAWTEVERNHPYLAQSHSYECGFKEGFRDYLDAGPMSGPPPLPPRRYWNTLWKTPEGQLAISDWYAGFRHGMAAASASGQRELITVPSAFSSGVVLAPPGLPLVSTPRNPPGIRPLPAAGQTILSAAAGKQEGLPHRGPETVPVCEAPAQTSPPPRVLRAVEGEAPGRAVVRFDAMPEPIPEFAHWHRPVWRQAPPYHPGTWTEGSHGQLVAPGRR